MYYWNTFSNISNDQFDYECELYTFIGNFFRLLLHSSFNLGCFIFSDRIFDEHMTTYDLFQEIAKPIIDAAVQGFHGELVMYLRMYIWKWFQTVCHNHWKPNFFISKGLICEIQERQCSSYLKPCFVLIGTIFAYGQSSSGKTFTMTGSAMHPGIIKLAVNEIFSRIDKVCMK